MSNNVISMMPKVLAVLRKENRPLCVPVIEAHLTIAADCGVSTYDVRGAVQALVEEGRAEFVHPGYLVRLKPELSP